MNRTPLRLLWGLLLLLSSTCAHAMTLTGLSVVCVNNTVPYSASAAGSGITYQWSMTTALGTYTASYGAATSVLWSAPGTTTIKVRALDGQGHGIDSATKVIQVKALPQPQISTTYRVGCQNFQNDTTRKEGQKPSDPGPLFQDDGPCPKVCENSWVTYTATGAPGSTFTWSISGGTPITATGPTVTVHWGAVGMGSISVTEKTVDGCTGTRTGCIEIIAKPHSKFGAMPDVAGSIKAGYIKVCLKQDVIFVDQSYTNTGSPIVGWYWDFGDGQTYSTSTTANPIHHYDNPGSYNVMLVVKNGCNCTDTSYLKVDVMDEEGIRITCASVVCEAGPDKNTASYTVDGGVPCDKYNWSVTGGTIVSPTPYGPTIEVLWDNVDANGFGYVHFDASNCDVKCPGITTIKIPVIQQKGTIKGELFLCEGKQYKYTLPAWPGTVFNWSLLGGGPSYLSHTDQPNEIVVHVMAGGAPVLHCDYSNSIAGCSGRADLQLKVVPGDAIVGDEVICQNTTGSVPYHLGSGSTATWTLTAPNGAVTTYAGVAYPALSFPQPGVYSLNAKGSFCLDAPLAIRVLATPSVVNSISGPDTVCVGTPAVPYEFTAGTAQAGTVFEWQVIGGTAQSPLSGSKLTVTFSGSGTHAVMVRRLSAQSPNCPGPWLQKTLYTPVIPIAINGKDTVCPNVVEHYTGGYSGGEAYEWSIISTPSNTGSINDNKQPNVDITWNNYSVPTPVTLQLKITRCGHDTVKTFHVVIMPAPVLSLGNDTTICSGAPINVVLGSSPALSSGTLNWYVDGAIMPPPVTLVPGGSNVRTFTFTNNSTTNSSTLHTVTAIVTTPNGCAASATTQPGKQITVLPAPVALVTPIGPIVHCGAFQPDALTATVQGGLGGPFTYVWSNSATTQSISAGSYGNYNVTVTGANGCSSVSNTVQILQDCGPVGCTISPAPSTSITATQHCGVVTVNLGYSTTNYTGGSVGYSISPTGIVNSYTQSTGSAVLTSTYPAAGKYDFDFSIPYYGTTGDPCAKHVSTQVVVPLIPELFYEINCSNGSGYRIKLLDHSNNYPGTAINKYSFYLDGVLMQANTANTWTSPYGQTIGTHNLKLTVTFTFNGVTDSCSVNRTLTLDPLPVADFSFDRNNVCVAQQAIQFTSTSMGVITSYNWNFGDFSTNLLQNPLKVYNDPGSWNVALMVSNAYGCSSLKTKTVNSVPNQLNKGLIPGDSVKICDGSSVTLVYSPPSPTATNYTWMKEQNVLINTTSSTLPVSQSGSYWIHVSDTVHGCWANTNHTAVTVISVPDPAITGDSLECTDNTYSLYGYAGNAAGISYQWTLNGSNYSTQPNLTGEVQTAPGIYNYQLKVTVTQGGVTCSKTSPVFKVVVNAPPAPPTVNFNIVGCDPYTVKLDASPSAPGTYNWSNGDSGNPIVANLGGPYKVWYTDNYGCTVSSDAVNVPKDPRGYLWIFPTGCYTKCPPITIPGPIIPFDQWAWYQPGGSVISSGTNSVVTPLTLNTGGLYGLFLSNGYCDASIDTLDLTVPKDCKTVDCDFLRVSTRIYDEDNCRIFYGWFDVTSTAGVTLPYTLTCNTGTIGSGGSGTIAPGSSSLYFTWYPPAGFSGGNVTFYITVTLPDGRTCTTTIIRPLKCGMRGSRPAPSGIGGVGSEAEGNVLTAVPNPARNTTVISYHFGSTQEGGTRAVEVYDMTGRRMAVHTTGTASGEWSLSLEGFAAGIYQVVLKEGGTVVGAARLSVTR